MFAPGGTVYSGTTFAVGAISEGLRQEVGEKVRVTSIERGAVESDLKFSTSGTAAGTVLDFCKQAIPANSVARAIAFAVEQPADVDINAIVIRPTRQDFGPSRGRSPRLRLILSVDVDTGPVPPPTTSRHTDSRDALLATYSAAILPWGRGGDPGLF